VTCSNTGEFQANVLEEVIWRRFHNRVNLLCDVRVYVFDDWEFSLSFPSEATNLGDISRLDCVVPIVFESRSGYPTQWIRQQGKPEVFDRKRCVVWPYVHVTICKNTFSERAW